MMVPPVCSNARLAQKQSPSSFPDPLVGHVQFCLHNGNHNRNSSVFMAIRAMPCDVHMICDDLMIEIILERCIWQLGMYLRTQTSHTGILRNLD